MPSLSLFAVLAYVATISVIVIGFIWYWRGIHDSSAAIRDAAIPQVDHAAHLDDHDDDDDDERNHRLNDPRRAERRALKRERKAQMARMREEQQLIQARREEARRIASEKREARAEERFEKMDLAIEQQRAEQRHQLELEEEARRFHEQEVRDSLDDIVQSSDVLDINQLANQLNTEPAFIISHLESYSGVLNSQSQWIRLDQKKLNEIQKLIMAKGRVEITHLISTLEQQ